MLDQLVGLTSLKRQVAIKIAACKIRNEIFQHAVLSGPGGTGKTAFARAIGDELGYHFVEIEGAVLATRNVVFDVLRRSISEAGRKNTTLLLFIDEVHRLNHKCQEAFYLPMKEFRISTIDHNCVPIPKFTLVAATTRLDMLDSNSFVSRFPNQWEFTRYDEVYIRQIIFNLCKKYHITCDYHVLKKISSRCLGIPRVATNVFQHIYDYLTVDRRTEITVDDVEDVCKIHGIDECGLTDQYRKYLNVLFSSSYPCGVASIASQTMQHEDILLSVIEPVLSSLGFIQFGPRGRSLSRIGSAYCKKMFSTVSFQP